MNSNNLNTDISNANVYGVPTSSPITSTPQTTPNTGVSSIEKSNATKASHAPLSNMPVLISPTGQSIMVLTDAYGNIDSSILLSITLRMSEISTEMAKNWSDSLAKMAEIVREIINSPQYLAMQQIRLHGDPQQAQAQSIGGVSTGGIPTGVVSSGVDATAFTKGVAASGVIAPSSVTPTISVGGMDPSNPQGSLIAYLDKLTAAFDRVSPSSKVPESSKTDDSTKMVTIPFTAAVALAGGVALVGFEMTTSVNGMTSNPLSSVNEVVSHLQPLYPQHLQDIIPMINLMVMPLIYYTSFDASVGNARNKEKSNDQATAQNFAKEVIKMVSDPTYILTTYVGQTDESEVLSQQKQARVAMIKLVLASVALSFLYSVQVGKVMDGKFWGMEPKEFQGMLTGEIPIADPKNDLPVSDQLKLTLLGQIKSQLDVLSPEDKMKTLESLFAYLTTTKSTKDMKLPGKVISDVLANSNFKEDAESVAV